MRERWDGLCRRLGRQTDAPAWFTILEGLHANPIRAYHNLGHVTECLDMLEQVRSLAEDADRLEFALWFHDCVYVPGKSDNEQRSAEVARVAALAIGQSDSWAIGVVDLIMTTRHIAPPEGNDAAIIADIDMAVLAANTERYRRYAAAIRSEYGFATDEQFRAGRAAFLRGLIARPSIYFTAQLASSCERHARANIAEELELLEVAGRRG